MEATREFIRDSLNGMVPFATHCGVEVTEVTAEGGRAELTPSVEIENHLGTLHAGALFTLGEAASGAAMSGVFADMILGLFLLLRPQRLASSSRPAVEYVHTRG